jgi:hypothetical protein
VIACRLAVDRSLAGYRLLVGRLSLTDRLSPVGWPLIACWLTRYRLLAAQLSLAG